MCNDVVILFFFCRVLSLLIITKVIPPWLGWWPVERLITCTGASLFILSTPLLQMEKDLVIVMAMNLIFDILSLKV